MSPITDELSLKLEVVPPHAEIVGRAKDDPRAWRDDALRLIEECGRVSHKSEGRIRPGSAEPFIRKVAIEWGHESILEHVCLTVCFVGSRSMSHQLVRHRIAAYTQESQRFCDYSGDGASNSLKIVVPPSVGTPIAGSVVRSNPEKSEILITGPGDPTCDVVDPTSPLWVYLEGALDAYRYYMDLRGMGVPAEDARELLPNATKTEVYTTFNLRQWRHFFRMRLDKHAQWQIKVIGREVFGFFKEWMPLLLEGLKTHSGEALT
jgi:thymidylate synthase (FAD)